MADLEIEYLDEGSINGDDEDDEDSADTITNIDSMALEMQQQIAAEIKQQQMEQRKLRQKHTTQQSPTSQPDITINGECKLVEAIVFSYNDIVELKDGREGKIKFIGTLGFQSHTWCGLILSTSTGSHNGIVKHRKYWNCKPNHGTFVKRNQIKTIKLHRIGERFTIHEKVKTPKGKAYIRFIGNIQPQQHDNEQYAEEYHQNPEKDIHDNECVMYGVELIDQMGENSGSINNQYYFSCAHYRGMFYTEKDLIWIAPDAPPTPRIPRRLRKKMRKNKPKNIDADKEEMEIIGLDENNESIDLDAFDDEVQEEEEEESISDSSSDGEFLSSDDVKRLSLLANGSGTSDDRLSFARILSDFKHVQKANVRSMAAKWENLVHSAQPRFSASLKKEKSEVELAQDIINQSRRRRADTSPRSQPVSSPYQPPRFADKLIYKNRKLRKNKTNELMQKCTQSTPVSPDLRRHQSHHVKYTPPTHPSTTFNKIASPAMRRGKGKAKKRSRKVQFDEVGSSASTPSTLIMSPTDSIDMNCQSPSPITLSPNTSNKSSQSMSMGMAVRKEPISPGTDHNAKSRGSIDDDAKMAEQTISFRKVVIPPNVNIGSELRTKRGNSAPLTKHAQITVITTPPQRSISSNGLHGLDINTVYTPPAIISPGGGMPSLTLQNSASIEHQHEDSVAVVDEISKNHSNGHGTDDDCKDNSRGPSAGGSSSSSLNSGGAGVPCAELVKSGSMSPTASNVYSLVFKSQCNESPTTQQKEFKLKARPDSPFDISSTQKDFHKVAEILMLECNNPKNLFKVLKGVCSKLKLPDPKYRRIDTLNSAVQNKLLKFEGAEEFLQLLGFKRNDLRNPTLWYCDMDQPPISVLDYAINVCNDCLLKCNHKRATMDMLKKFSTHELKNKKRRKKRHKKASKSKNKKKANANVAIIKRDNSMHILTENTEVRYRTGSLHVDGTVISEDRGYKKPANINVTHLSPLTPQGSFDMDGSAGVPYLESPQSGTSNPSLQLPNIHNLRATSLRIDDATETLSNLDDIKFELELEGGDEDRFQLSDIIWSVTHKDNTDRDAREIILLCFPTFSHSDKLIKCLIERFFESQINDESQSKLSRESSVSYGDDDSVSAADETSLTSTSTPYLNYFGNSNSGNMRIESLWETQVKVVSFLQQWMRTYWQEDWHENEKMLDIVEQFCIKIENCYKNDPNLTDKDVKKGMKLIKMIHQTMDFQEASLRSKKKKNANLLRQMSIPSKFDKMTEIGASIKKMRYDFIKLDNKRLGEQITLLDFKYFRAIQKRECLGQHWKKRNKYEIAPNICALIDQFNKMSKWVQATILLARNVKTRGRLIKKFIKISNHLLALRNFQSLCAFHGALSSVPIHKLKHAWNYVPAKHIARFEEMRVIFNTRNNMGNLRKLHREAHAPLVPYTGIFLSDLVSIEEGNTKHKDDGTVNFAKLMRLSNAIDNILLYQRTQYEIQDDIAVQSLLMQDFKINAKLDAEYIYKFSADVARKDQPKKQKTMLSIFSSK